jgi:hypothetical protein
MICERDQLLALKKGSPPTSSAAARNLFSVVKAA